MNGLNAILASNAYIVMVIFCRSVFLYILDKLVKYPKDCYLSMRRIILKEILCFSLFDEPER